jgi:nucleotide-binding universal stress UspA family protein
MQLGSGPLICGVDLSDASRYALQYAHALAAQLGQPLIVVSAIDPLIAEAAHVRMGPAPFVEQVQRDLESFVRESVAADATAQPALSILTPSGPAAKELLHAAAAAKAGAIVIGTEGLGRARRFVFGSTTLRVMRGTNLPVLAVPPPTHDGDSPGRIDQIVCGVDFSGPSKAAAEEAVALGRHLNVRVSLVHAVGRLAMPSIWEAMMAPTDEERAAEDESRLKALAGSLGPPAPSPVVAIGEPHEIVGKVTAGAATLIVLGLGDLSGHRPGSTAMRIMASTHLPVLGVPVTTAIPG